MPHIVVLGFYTLDLERSLLAAKGIPKGGILFTKPRFILNENNQLELINYPTISPELLLNNVKKLEDYPFIEFNYNYDELRSDFENRWYRYSVLLSFCEEILKINKFTYLKKFERMYDVEQEPAILNLRIIKKFLSAVSLNRSRFIVVDIPKFLDMQNYIVNSVPMPYDKLVDSIGSTSELVRTADYFREYAQANTHLDLFDKGGKDSFFAPHGHYSALGNNIISDALFEYLSSDNEENHQNEY
ncbi:MAG: hypothetical protein JKX73_08265 [Flavobacteriales bacterium]|nr:hypothetical protein [Flavobacteriales bacterium]